MVWVQIACAISLYCTKITTACLLSLSATRVTIQWLKQQIIFCSDIVTAMRFAAVLMVIALLTLLSAPRISFVASAQQSGSMDRTNSNRNTDETSSNVTLPIKYPPRVMTAPNQLCLPDLNQEDIRSQVEEDIYSIFSNQVLPLLNLEGHSETNPAASCSELFLKGWNSGYYWISTNGSSAVEVYCDMNRHCCNSSSGWMRVAYLNMTDHTQQCPDGWRELTTQIRTCRRANGSYVNSVVFNTSGMFYNRVCGRIIGYQYGSPEAFILYNRNITNYNIENNYVDGVSVTYGQQGHRRHIWTFVGAKGESYQGRNVCPCTNTSNNRTIRIPPWVGTDYFCDSGTTISQEGTFYQQDPLWDGQGCGPTSTCCSYNQPPWFCKQLSETTSENIEVRLMTGAYTMNSLENEDTPIQFIELYIQ